MKDLQESVKEEEHSGQREELAQGLKVDNFSGMVQRAV